jgi:thiamine biosynthesis lipoprotein
MRSAAFDGDALGSPIRLAVRGTETPDAAWRAVRDELAAVDAELSGHRRDSALAALNARPGSLGSVPRRLRVALGVAWRAHRRTDGLFDPRRTRGAGAGGRAAWLIRRGRALATGEPLDLDGIGKGLALRWCAGRLAALGIADYLLVAGGDLVAAGSASAGHSWRVSLAGIVPTVPTAVIDLPATPAALATSGVTRQRDHIVDPRTGRPVRGPLLQVSVAARDPAWAEVWAKVGLIRGAVEPDIVAWWLSADGTLGATSRATVRTAWRRTGAHESASRAALR